MPVNPRRLRPVAGLPYNRTFSLFQDLAQLIPDPLTGYTVHFVVKTAPGRLGREMLHLTNGAEVTIAGTQSNQVKLTLWSATTAKLRYGVYELYAVKNSNPNDVKQISRGPVEPTGKVAATA